MTRIPETPDRLKDSVLRAFRAYRDDRCPPGARYRRACDNTTQKICDACHVKYLIEEFVDTILTTDVPKDVCPPKLFEVTLQDGFEEGVVACLVAITGEKWSAWQGDIKRGELED